jgi:tetratricopeptide (TPR) repeat protein
VPDSLDRAATLHRNGHLSQAAEMYARIVAKRPAHFEAKMGLAKVLGLLGQSRESLALYEEAIRLNPNSAAAAGGKGLILNEIGRSNEAGESFRRAIALNPQSVHYYYNLVNCQKLSLEDPVVGVLEAFASNAEKLQCDDKIMLHFALAKIYDDNGEIESAFGQLVAGTSLKRKTTVYAEATTIGRMESTRRTFTKDFIHSNVSLGVCSDLPIFIFGMPRSGSTLVEQILASHPSVVGGGEISDLMETTFEIAEREDAFSIHPDGTQDLWRSLGDTYVRRLRKRAPSAVRITDKMPDNFRLAGFIHLALPNAKMIHTQRHPADTCLSCFSKLFLGGVQYSYDLGELGRYYQSYTDTMRHWREVLPPGAILDIRYGDLVRDLVGQTRRLLAYCQLEWDARCLDFHLSERQVKTASASQVRMPTYGSSIGRWRLYERNLAPLLEVLQSEIVTYERTARPRPSGLLRRLPSFNAIRHRLERYRSIRP